MIRNYLKIAFRNLWKNKGFSAINIAGLAIGLATCLLMLFYVTDELSYDKFNEKADRIYRVDGDIQFGGNHFVLAVAPDPMGQVLKKDFPQVEQYVRFRGYGGLLVKKGNQNINEEKVIYADSTLFDVFTLPMIQGDPKTALVEPNSVVITETTARKYFNSTDVVGKNFVINDTVNFKITGVIKDIPSQSHFNFDFFVSLSSNDESRQNNWVSNNFNTYIVLKKGADPKKLEAQFPSVVTKYVGPQVKQLMNINMEEFAKGGNYDTYHLTPITSIHLHSNKTAELGANSSIEFVYIFSFIAVLILLIACVNFMNLSTARSSNRAKEVGVRKVLGSLRKSLVAQFLTESVLISFIALILAIIIAWLMLPYFNQLSGKQLGTSVFENPWLFPALIALMVVVGVIAGSYPAFFLSAFKPVEVLKGKLSKGFKGSWLRSGLVVFQFFISIALIVGTIVIYNQLKFIRSKDLGYNRNQVLIIKNTFPLGNNAKVFKDEVLQMAGVQNATMTGFLPTSEWRSDSPLFPDATLNQKTAVSAQIWRVDENYISTLDMKMIEGRNFSKDFPTDSSGIIINESAAKLLGFKNPLNKTLYYLNNFNNNKDVTAYHILGVVKDFNFSSLRDEVTPLALMYREQNGSISFRINTTDIPNLISNIESKWKAMAVGQPFTYSFMDDDFNKTYLSEQRTGKIFISFAIFAIFIACLGLFGLVTYAAEQRTREIGIRKVLGASVSGIVGMLSKDFLKLIIIAMLIAFPVAWWAMHTWLQHFAYRISITLRVFVIAGGISLLIALLTVSFQAIKAALANPVRNLRTE
ncbi:FtsX-like permease family protein [Ginsengibacter hankyongi]|uniref:FtsX-like permease family protein n=1 Tax=Ginsengibacter hankyongi TaxID=2607284 RepID=A0A5J5IIP6_9BACT|nr:ABC transporter permease [Ginsengibacter hankyongi]KAA9040900.1 FtsX-like permease family protein [Ginsengibacter hankyongi]